MGETGNNLKKVPTKIAVLVAQWMFVSPACIIMTLEVGSGKSPVNRGSMKLIFPPFHPLFESLWSGEPTVPLTKGEVITLRDTDHIALLHNEESSMLLFFKELASPDTSEAYSDVFFHVSF